MRDYTGLSELRSVGSNEVYCPKCRNYLRVVPNGLFHGQLFYCSHEKKVFCVKLWDITKKAGKEYLESCKKEIKVKELRRKITKENYKKFEDLL